MKHILVIPVFNDWKSLNKLIHKLDIHLKSNIKINNEILIIDDNSTQKLKLNLKKLNIIKSIKIISLKKNYGSQKAIAIGLNYLKKIKGKFFVTVMDGDGEDSPAQIEKMLLTSINNPSYVITSNRKKREETFIIILLYKLHLLITFLFTFKWISFGNFSTFNKKNLNNLLSNNSSWYAHSSSVLKNCKIKRLYSKREKRYYDKSKLGLFSLIEHSLRVNTVFYKNIFFSSIIYLFLINRYIQDELSYLLILAILIFNFSIFWIKSNHYINNLSKVHNFIKKIKLIKTL
jgi:polyisoprenyl-phosphate glycosyltransferase